MNKAMSIYAVQLYKLYGVQWVFDDPSKDIVAEAFVSGADTLIDKIINEKYGQENDTHEPQKNDEIISQINFPEPDKRGNDTYIIRFSSSDFPGSYSIQFQPREGLRNNSIDPKAKEGMKIVDSGSYWVYEGDDGEHLLWLSDTLNEYFSYDDRLLYFDIVLPVIK